MSKPTANKDKTETVSITLKKAGGTQREDVQVDVTIPKGTSAEDKAKAIAKALDDHADLKASADKTEVKVQSDKAGFNLKTLTKTNNSAEPTDKVTIQAAPVPPTGGPQQTATLMCLQVDDGILGTDPSGAVSFLRAGTARGTVTIPMTDLASAEEAVARLGEGLTALGLLVTMPDPNTLCFGINSTLDKYLLYGCTEPGVLQTITLDDASE